MNFQLNNFQKLFIFVIIFLGFFGLAKSSQASTPTISGVSGTVVTGQTITISGANMVNEDTTNWDSFFTSHPNASEFGGASPIADGYGCPSTCSDNGVNRQWKAVYDTSTKVLGNQSVKFHVEYLDASNVNIVSYLNASPSDPWSGNRWVRYYTRFNTNFLNTDHLKQFITFGGSRQSGFDTYPKLIGWRMVDYTAFLSGTPTPTGTLIADMAPLQINRWYLVELHYQEGTAPYSMTAYLDGQQIATGIQASALLWSGAQIGMINTIINSPGGFMDNWFGGYAMSTSRIYAASKIEISDNPNYGQGTLKYQEPVYLSDGSEQFKMDLTGLGSGPYYLFVTNNRQQTSSVYPLSGNVDTTPPAAPSGLAVQ